MGNHRLLHIPKTGFAEALEVLADGVPELALDFDIAVDEAPAQTARQLPPDGGFARTGHTDEAEGHWQADGGVFDEIVNTYEVSTPPGEVAVSVKLPVLTSSNT